MLTPTKELQKNIQVGLLDDGFIALYGVEKIEEQKQRYLHLLTELERQQPEADALLINAPGRTELCGNHTDHNHGCVLAAAVDLDCVAAITPTDNAEVILVSSDFASPIRVNFEDLDPRKEEYGTPEGLIRGMAAGITKQKGFCKGFHGILHATCQPGTGLSSSAAFSLLVGNAFNALYHGHTLSATQLAIIARKAENSFFGKPCGLMDQMASAIGQTIFADFYHPEKPKVEQIEHSLDGSGYKLALIDTGGSHTNLTPEYAAIPYEMLRASQVLGKPFARDVSPEMFFDNINSIRKEAGDRATLRLLHFIEENRRTETVAGFLRDANIAEYLQGVRDSGKSSAELLQNCATTTDSQHQGILLALALSGRICPEAICRVHGGGFAGTVQAYVPKKMFMEYQKTMEHVFGAHSVLPIRIGRPGVCALTGNGLLLPPKE